MKKFAICLKEKNPKDMVSIPSYIKPPKYNYTELVEFTEEEIKYLLGILAEGVDGTDKKLEIIFEKLKKVLK